MTEITERRSASPQPGTQALVRGLRVLDAMATTDKPIGVGDLARQIELPKSTVQRLLKTLAQEGWVQMSSDPITRWQLSPRMLALARHGVGAQTLREAAMRHLRTLAERTGETIHLSALDRDIQLVLVERVDSIHPVRTFNPIGAITALHASSSGKAVLARLPDDQVKQILARPLAQVMPNTVTDPEHLMHQIRAARERGYAVNVSENRAHVCAVGAAVADAAGKPVAAVAISMPDIRFDPDRVPQWGQWVRDTANAISDGLNS